MLSDGNSKEINTSPFFNSSGIILFLFIGFLHVCGILFYFGAINFFTDTPIYNHDYPYHLYHCWEAKHYISQGHSWGYNPYFMAGYIQSNSFDNDLLQLIASFLSFQGQIRLVKIWTFLILMFLPLIVYFSSINFGLNKKSALASVCLFFLYLYNDYFVNSVIYFGMFNFLLGSAMALLNISMIYRYIMDREKKITWGLLFSFPFLFLIHASTWLTFFIPFLIIYGLFYKDLKANERAFLVALVAVPSIFTFIWGPLSFLIHAKPYVLKGWPFIFQIYNVKELLSDFIYNRTAESAKGLQLIKASIMVLGVMGLKNFSTDRRFRAAIASTWISLFIVTYCHNLFHLQFLADIQPYKYIFPMVLFFIAPAGKFVCEFMGNSEKRAKSFGKVGKAVLLIFLAVNIIYIQGFNPPRHGFFTDPPKDYTDLEDWILKNTNSNGRILLESELAARNFFEKPSFANGLLVYKTKRQFLSVPHRFAPVAQNFAALTKNGIFQTDWQGIDKDSLKKYFDLYNVGWVIAGSRKAMWNLPAIFKNSDLFSRKWEIGSVNKKFGSGFQIYEVNRELNFIDGGTGTVRVGFNNIKVTDLKTDNDNIILKYHWHPTLAATHNLQIVPVYLYDAPMPFIKVLNVNTPEFEIYNAYRADERSENEFKDLMKRLNENI